VLRDEGELYAAQLQKAGVRTKLLRCNGMPHGFASLAGFIKRGQYYLDQVCSEIQSLIK
jgi:acetyl esterase